MLSIMVSSFQIGANNFKQLLRRFDVQSTRMLLGIDEMRAHVVFDDLGHQTGRGPSHSGNEMHDLFAASLAVEGAFDGFDLAPDAAHARQQLVLFTDGVCHAAL